VMHRLREFIRIGRIEAAPVAVATLIEHALAIMRPELDRGGIVFEARLDRGLPLVRVDALQVEQVLINLIRNATEALTQAGRTDGRIVIEGVQQPGAVELRVIDNGPGLDPDIAGQPISAFTTTKAEGLGLGLSLSRSIITAHGGQLRIDNGPGGVCAAFTLAAADKGG
jgi:two-component system sensor kinase FixL